MDESKESVVAPLTSPKADIQPTLMSPVTGFSRPVMMWVTPSMTPPAWLVRRGLARSSSSDMLARNPKCWPAIVYYLH